MKSESNQYRRQDRKRSKHSRLVTIERKAVRKVKYGDGR